MRAVIGTRLLLPALTLLAVIHAAASFMCHTKTLGKDDASVTLCSSGTCYSVGGSVGESKDAEKGCAEDHHETGCIAGGIPGILSAHTCYCNTPLCNSAYAPTLVLPLLVLPALLQRLL